MKLKTLRFYNNEGEKMASIFLLNDDNSEVKQFSFYNKKEEIKAQKELEDSIRDISSFIKEVYEMGKNGIELDFSEQEILVNS